ncbi:hypothetical protein DIC66_09520 [Rhodoferax lacus]|uniref:Bacterial Ig domain-containing protein n=1 Tax=Rhodoferax lacus TaxID=2184758 RepID=A0A3E1RDJ4_9BURK|nr:hypothetical protein DIC66_09520 [Rhodoferax lacus]
MSALSVAVLATGCGGGGSSSAASTPTQNLAGTAATGAAFSGASIVVTDRNGTVVGTSAPVGADGRFNIAISASAQAPFVLTATRTNAEGAVETLVSVVPTAPGVSSTATVNISPVTNLIASRLSASGDPSRLASEVGSGASTVDAITVAASVSEVQTILATLISAAGATGIDPLTGSFAANGTGYDRMLDAIQVTLTPDSATSTNIEVSIKQTLADGAAPIVTAFNSQSSSVAPLPAISAVTLPVAGTSVLIAQELAQLTACFALPTATRVDSPVSAGVATGTAANVVASACTTAFLGNDPNQFLGNGSRVGRDDNNNGAFSGLFRDAATGQVFSQGSYEFSRPNGDIVVSYKTRDRLGNESFDTAVLREDLSDGKLKLIGNQYTYPGGVAPYHQLRTFVNQPDANYYSTGYDIRIPLIPNISYVQVTPPGGTTITLVPGSDSMVLPKRNVAPPTASGTTFVRLRSEYVASSGAPTPHPSALEAGLFFPPSDYTEAALAAMPGQGVWTFAYFSGGTNASGGTLQQTQHYRTRSRASTLAELRTQAWARLSDTSIADLVTRSSGNGTTNGFATLPLDTALATSWVVPTGALPPSGLKLFGNAIYFDYASLGFASGNAGYTSTTNGIVYPSVRTSFNDGQAVGSTARSANAIACANGAIDANDMGEQHCADPGPGYWDTARQTGLHLFARDARGREFAHFYAPYTLQ